MSDGPGGPHYTTVLLQPTPSSIMYDALVWIGILNNQGDRELEKISKCDKWSLVELPFNAFIINLASYY